MTHLTFDGLIRAESDATMIATLLRKGWTQLPPQPQPDATWNGSAWVLSPPPPPPATISPRQARLWLLRSGITPAQVDAVIASIPDAQTRQTVQIDWEYGLEVSRASPFVTQLGAALGLDADSLDDAFREAAAL